MSAAGLDVFDKTLQVTNIWLDEIMRDLGPDRHLAWKVRPSCCSGWRLALRSHRGDRKQGDEKGWMLRLLWRKT